MSIAELHQLFLKSNGICTDTRKLHKNELFFALKGENFDGNLYAEKALSEGASLSIVDDKSTKNPKCIQVDNVLKCLQDLANYHRNYLNIPILALTGSNGKTTTKELLEKVLSKKLKTTATKGNLNNHIGVPLTLLSMTKETEMGIVEMGANHLKEIEFLSNIAEPNYGYITNIGKAHLEGFGSEENILTGKTELFEFIRKKEGVVFCNSSDEKLMQKSEDLERVLFSQNNDSEFKINSIENSNFFVSVKFNDTVINSQLIGNYNFSNIAASIAIGAYFGVLDLQIKEAIESYTPKINRSQIVKKESNNIILDAYNANPTSMKAAIDNFKKIESKQQKYAILGDMFELGKYANEEHKNILDTVISSCEIDWIFLVGENFCKLEKNSERVLLFKSTELLIKYLKKKPKKNGQFLIKGSRGMALERVVEFL